MAWQERITFDNAVLAGKPTIRGTRLSVKLILDLLAGGWSETDVLESYPHISSEDIRACLHYAANALREERIYPTPAA